MRTAASGTWLESRARRPAPEVLAHVVEGLTRARRVQALMEHLWFGIFWAIVLASLAVLLIRISGAPYPLPAVVAGALLTGMAVAAVLARVRRPGTLAVAIGADLSLNLKQQLSTAWEFACNEGDSPLAGQLAAQAVRARLPTRPELIFPLRYNLWGRMIPAAVLLLVLVVIVDLPTPEPPQAGSADVLLRSEGVRLRQYGQRMETRAQRDELDRSEQEARQMQRLGSRMESGSLSRRQALDRLGQLSDALDAQARDALGEADATRVGPLSVQALEQRPRSSSALGGLSARAMLDRLLDGDLRPGELDSLRRNPGGLSGMGIPASEVEEALKNFSRGDQSKLRELLEQLARTDRALEDAAQLDDARRQVEQAAENLGDAGAPERGSGREPAEAAGEGGDDMDDFPGGQMAEDSGGGANNSAGRYGSGDQDGNVRRETAEPGPSPGESSAAVLKPDAAFGEGEVFVSEARVLPRTGDPEVQERELDPRFRSQMEDVLSKEAWPMHQKAFVRRYFLNLSEGSEEQQ